MDFRVNFVRSCVCIFFHSFIRRRVRDARACGVAAVAAAANMSKQNDTISEFMLIYRRSRRRLLYGSSDSYAIRMRWAIRCLSDENCCHLTPTTLSPATDAVSVFEETIFLREGGGSCVRLFDNSSVDAEATNWSSLLLSHFVFSYFGTFFIR